MQVYNFMRLTTNTSIYIVPNNTLKTFERLPPKYRLISISSLAFDNCSIFGTNKYWSDNSWFYFRHKTYLGWTYIVITTKNDFLLRKHLNMFFATLKNTHLFDVYQTVAGLLEICVDVVLLKS